MHPPCSIVIANYNHALYLEQAIWAVLIPTISIIMPSCNQAAYLEEAIASVLHQGYPQKELIIIDGGSTDGSVDIIQKYERRLAYWVSEKDGGQSHAICKGVARASGQWLNWINSDDALLPGALQAIADAAAKYPDADIVVGRGVLGDERGRITEVTVPVNPRMWMPKHVCYGRFCQQSTFWTRRAYESVEGINERLYFRMDIDLLERMISAGLKARAIAVPIGFFREYADTKSGLQQSRRQQEFDDRLRELGISRLERWGALQAMRACRVLSGNCFRAWAASARLRGQCLSGLWSEALATGTA